MFGLKQRQKGIASRPTLAGNGNNSPDQIILTKLSIFILQFSLVLCNELLLNIVGHELVAGKLR